jgi:acetyltransferase-like isoleucine patch superfamily enzyme
MSRHTPATLLGALIARLRICSSQFWLWEARLKGVEFLGRCELQGRPKFSVAAGARIVVGDGVRIASAVRANPLGLSQPTTLRALAPGAQLVLGREVGLSGCVLCAARSIEIGERTLFGAGAMALDTDFRAPVGEWGWNDDCTAGAQPIKIGRGVFIGARAIILKGVNIGDRAVLGAGAVVTEDVPAHYFAVGNPARCFPSKQSTSA